MTSRYRFLQERLRSDPRRWLVSGAAGFIGSHLVQKLLELGQEVAGLDNFATGRRANLDDVRASVGEEAWSCFELIEGDLRDPADCRRACAGARHVLHQAALGSVPRSMKDPVATHQANVDGFLNLALAARDAGSASFVYASSSSVYGDHPDLPKVEGVIGEPLSPYAASKRIDEIYAGVIERAYGLRCLGLRYFNVFGPRQDPEGAYAAVVPAWAARLRAGERIRIHGDGETSRDFCPVANVVQANLLAADPPEDCTARVFNVALGGRTTLNELYALLRDGLARRGAPCAGVEPDFDEFRPGDVRHSQADISCIVDQLGFAPEHDLRRGMEVTLDWYAAAPCGSSH